MGAAQVRSTVMRRTMVMFAGAMFALASCGSSAADTNAEPDDNGVVEPAPTSCVFEEIEDEYGMMVEVETCE